MNSLTTDPEVERDGVFAFAFAGLAAEPVTFNFCFGLMTSDFNLFHDFKLLTDTLCILEILYRVSPLLTVYVLAAAELSSEVLRNKASAKLRMINSFFKLFSPFVCVLLTYTKIAWEYYRHVTIKDRFHYNLTLFHDISTYKRNRR